MWALFKYFIKILIDWVFRRRSPALIIMRIGLSCLALAFGAGWVLNVSIPLKGGQFGLSFDSAGGTPTGIVYAAAALGFVLMIIGLAWEAVRFRKELRRVARKKVIVIETRGLRDSGGVPLIDAIPHEFEGNREHVLVDFRQGVKDGEIVSPEAALERLVSLPIDLKRRETGLDRRDITLVYGGLASVPLTFLTGILIDDEGAVIVFDWDRHAQRWRQLDGEDDGRRFRREGFKDIASDATEVALAVSVSYRINLDDVGRQVGDMPVVHLVLEDGSPDCHWSEVKQRALGQQFLESAIALGNFGVGRIHLFLAAQNSVVFRFGRLYDKRNLPQVVVYQYQKDQSPPFPWAILMPVCGIARPVVLR